MLQPGLLWELKQLERVRKGNVGLMQEGEDKTSKCRSIRADLANTGQVRREEFSEKGSYF